MSKRSINNMSSGQMIDEYRSLAINHRKASRVGDFKSANASAKRLVKIAKEFMVRGSSEISIFTILLDDNSVEVRGWAAAHCLFIAAEKSEAVLESIAAGPESLEEFSAKVVLREWRSGNLVPL